MRILTLLVSPTQNFDHPVERLGKYLSQDPKISKQLDAGAPASSNRVAIRVKDFASTMVAVAAAKVSPRPTLVFSAHIGCPALRPNASC